MKSIELSTVEIDPIFETLSREINSTAKDTVRYYTSFRVPRLTSEHMVALKDALNCRALTKDQTPWAIINLRTCSSESGICLCYCRAIDFHYLVLGW